jgi:hypothetical protein
MIHEVTGFLIPFPEIWSRLSGMYDLSEMDELVSTRIPPVMTSTYKDGKGFDISRTPQFSQSSFTTSEAVPPKHRLGVQL